MTPSVPHPNPIYGICPNCGAANDVDPKRSWCLRCKAKLIPPELASR